MAIKRVWITDECIGCGLSESVCPEVFTVSDKATVNGNVDFSAYEDKIKEAAEQCPVSSIKYE